jgi:hypothetical protein
MFQGQLTVCRPTRHDSLPLWWQCGRVIRKQGTEEPSITEKRHIAKVQWDWHNGLMADQVELLKRLYDRFNAHDMESVLAAMHQDVSTSQGLWLFSDCLENATRNRSEA